MANYLTHYTKRRVYHEHQEWLLLRLLAVETSHEELLTAAQRVRETKILALRARRATIDHKNDQRSMEVVAKIDQDIGEIRAASLDMILDSYRRKLAHRNESHRGLAGTEASHLEWPELDHPSL